jgi:hypothetical protein
VKNRVAIAAATVFAIISASHRLALAGGWYLMVPPEDVVAPETTPRQSWQSWLNTLLGQNTPVAATNVKDCAISDWKPIRAYDSAESCEQMRRQFQNLAALIQARLSLQEEIKSDQKLSAEDKQKIDKLYKETKIQVHIKSLSELQQDLNANAQQLEKESDRIESESNASRGVTNDLNTYATSVAMGLDDDVEKQTRIGERWARVLCVDSENARFH